MNYTQFIYKLIRFDFLTSGNVLKKWFMILGILIYTLASTWLSHLSEEKAKRIYRLNLENRRLRSEYVMLKARWMKKRQRTAVYDAVKNRGFVIPKRQPVKIIAGHEK